MIGCVRRAPGESISITQPGDVVLVRSRTWLGFSIRLFERLRYRDKNERAFAYWSHAALVVSTDGDLIEVGRSGVFLSHIERFRNIEYHYIRLGLSEEARSKAVGFAYSCLAQKYGVWSFLLQAASLLLGDRLRIPDLGQQGCVALVVRALQVAGLTFERSATDMMPADLAKAFGVTP